MAPLEIVAKPSFSHTMVRGSLARKASLKEFSIINLTLQSMGVLEIKNYRNTSTWRDEWTGTTRKNACNRETMRMMKIRVVIIFIIAQVALTKHTSRRSVNTVVEDRAQPEHGDKIVCPTSTSCQNCPSWQPHAVVAFTEDWFY